MLALLQSRLLLNPYPPPLVGWANSHLSLTTFASRRFSQPLPSRCAFARRRFGRYEVLDFVAVLLGYAISGERTLEAFYERLSPWADVFMALFGRERLPARSTLSRFLAALSPEPVEALRTCFLKDLLARPLDKEEHVAGVWDRQGTLWIVFDVDGTREAARQRALPVSSDRPPPQRRLRPCVLLDTPAASVGKSSTHVLRRSTRTPINGWPALETPAMAGIERNCAARWQRSEATSRHTAFPKNRPS